MREYLSSFKEADANFAGLATLAVLAFDHDGTLEGEALNDAATAGGIPAIVMAFPLEDDGEGRGSFTFYRPDGSAIVTHMDDDLVGRDGELDAALDAAWGEGEAAKFKQFLSYAAQVYAIARFTAYVTGCSVGEAFAEGMRAYGETKVIVA